MSECMIVFIRERYLTQTRTHTNSVTGAAEWTDVCKTEPGVKKDENT